MAAVTQPRHHAQSHARVHQPRPRLPSHGHNHIHNHSHSNSRSHNNHHPSLYTQPMMSQSHVHLQPPVPAVPSQPHPLHPASLSSSSSSYAPYPAAYPSFDASTHAMLMYPPFTASFPSSVPSAFSAPLAVPQPQPQTQLSHPLPLPQQQQHQQSMLQQGLSQQHLALLMQHAWLQQQQQQQVFPPSTSVYSSHSHSQSVCFPSTSYPLPYPVSVPSLSSVPLLTHAHMHAPMDSSWIYAHTSPSDSSSNISSASSSRTCSPTYHLPCTGCDGVCTCSHLLAPISMSHSHSHSQPPSCTSQASIGTSIETPEPPRSFSPPALMLPPILIPPQPRSVHSAVIHRSGSGSGSDEDDDDNESSDADSESSSTSDNVAQALASTHLSEMPPLTLTSSTSTSSNPSNSSFSGSIRNNFETPLMIIDDEDNELVHVISPSSLCASTPSSTRRVAPTRMRSMTVMGMLMAASQRQATTPHPARPPRLSQRMSILRPMAMSTPVSPVDHTRDRDRDDDVDAVQTSTIPTVPVSTSFEAPTSLSMSLSPLHPLEWPISSSVDVDDKCDDEYACDDEYDKCTRDFSIPSRVTYQLPTKQDELVKSKPFSYADVVRAKQPQPQPTRDRASSSSHSHSHVIHRVTRIPHVASRA